ncbi:MAG: AfsR/SARP family transcriptional regulator, partial [Actinomycetota bacterium]
DLFRIFIGGTLLGGGKLDEADAVITDLVARFRASGPPTFLNWALYLQAAAADIGGDPDRAGELYDQALNVEVPPQTNSPNDVLRARTLYRRGRHRQAFAVLRTYSSELLETGNLGGATIVAIEFINLMVAHRRLDLAATVMGYIDSTGLLEVEGPAFRLLVDEASSMIDGDPETTAIRRRSAAEGIDDRRSLQVIRDLLDTLLDLPD